jgi:hypothetical protein
MNAILIAVSVAGPLLPVVLFPTRFFGRGLTSTIVGAAMLVGMMMAMYFGMQAMLGDGSAAPAAGEEAGISGADLAALEKLF